MLEAHHYTAAAKPKGSYALPAEYDGTVNEAALYHAVRAIRNNQRQGTASTKTRSEVSGGNQKPWRQKGTGRARQGSTRAVHWVGGGVAFGPRPRSYRTDLPRKVRQLARRSALNARAGEGAIHVIEALEFEAPKTKQMVELLGSLGLDGKKVLVLTQAPRSEVYLSTRNLPNAKAMPYGEASALDILWADALVIEEAAIGGHVIEKTSTRVKRAKKAAAAPKKTKRATATKKTAKKATKRAKKTKTTKKKGAGDA